jgi:flavodoxin
LKKKIIMKALVIYHSKTGITREFAYEINKYLKENTHDSTMMNIYDVHPEDITKADAVFIGCWTHGLFFIFQHPDKIWREHAINFPDMHEKKVAFFTTYKVLTGSMFNKMQTVLKNKLSKKVDLQMKSRNGKMDEKHKEQIRSFIS